MIDERHGGRTDYNISKRPLQAIPFKDKIANKYAWWKDCVDYYAGAVIPTENRELIELYDWYNGRIDRETFYKVENPYSTTDEKLSNFPADLRPFDIVRKVVDLFIGEYRERAFSFTVNIHNPDAQNKMLEEFENRIAQLLREVYIQELSAQGADTTAVPKELSEEDRSLLEKGYDENYKDERAIEGQYALDYIAQTLNLDHQYAKNMLHWCIAGIVASYKNVVREEVVYEIVNPLELRWDYSVEFIEDGEYATRTQWLPFSKVLEMFYDELTKEEIDLLETKAGQKIVNTFLPVSYQFNDLYKPASIQVIHTTWKSVRKIGVLKFIDEFGLETEVQVDETYKLSPEEKLNGYTIEWMYINEVYEGYRINGNIYLRMRVVPAQRNEINNFASCKLPYNGRFFSAVNSANTSIAKLAKPYAILYILVFYQFELTLAKNGGKMLLIDKSTIPKDWDLEQFMYYAKALGYAFVDTQQPNASRTFNQYNALDMSTLQHCAELLQTASAIRQEMEYFFGITPQRQGQISNSSRVGTTEQAITQSSIISEQVFALYDEFIQRDLQGLLDCSKFAWINGKKAMFISSDQRQAILDIDPENYVSYDMGVIVTNRKKDIAALEAMKQNSQAFSQNGASPSTILSIMEAKSISKLKEYLETAEKQQQKIAQQQNQMETESAQQLQQAQMQMQSQLEQLKSDLKMREMELAHQFNMELETLKGQFGTIKMTGMDSDANGVPDALEIERLSLDRQIAMNDDSFRERELALQERQQMIDAQIKATELSTKLATEKLKAQTALKNKTSGEK
jgi:hypothetical protein